MSESAAAYLTGLTDREEMDRRRAENQPAGTETKAKVEPPPTPPPPFDVFEVDSGDETLRIAKVMIRGRAYYARALNAHEFMELGLWEDEKKSKRDLFKATLSAVVMSRCDERGRPHYDDPEKARPPLWLIQALETPIMSISTGGDEGN